MEFIILILTFIPVQAVGVITPSASLVVAIRNALLYPPKTASITALGVSCATLFQVSIIVLGVASMQGVLLDRIVKIVGGCYLLYLGYVTWNKKTDLTKFKPKKQEAIDDISASNAFLDGFIANMASPQLFFFFIGLFSVFISEETPWQLSFIYLCIVCITTFFWFSFVAFSVSHKSFKEFFSNSIVWVEKITGFILIGIGLKLLLSGLGI